MTTSFVAQQSHCGVDNSTPVLQDPTFNKSQFPNCNFNVNYVKDNCLEVYVKVNIHYFINTDGSGLTAAASPQDRYTPDQAFQAAEDLVASANTHHELVSLNDPWNQAFWGAPITTAQCVPIKFLINKVLIHRSTGDKNVFSGTQFAAYRNNNPDGLNVFITNILSAGVDGYAYPNGRFSVIENFSPDNFVHELGHCFTLGHTHDDGNDLNGTLSDGCLDTWWRPIETYDADNDGSPEETDIEACWDNYPAPIDVDGNGTLDDIYNPDGTVVINRHPCCRWEYQNNNVMTHGGFKANPDYDSYTPCQMERALTNSSTSKCDLIADINPACPMPAAVIGINPNTDIEAECYFGLNLQASMSDDEFRVTVELKGNNGNYTPYNGPSSFSNNLSSWTSGPASGYLIAVGYLDIQQLAHTILLKDRDYRITLEVRNLLCGDVDAHSIEFTTYSVCNRPHGKIAEDEVDVYPNPFWDGTTLTYKTLESADVQIFTSGFNTSGTYEPPTLRADASGQKEAGTYQVDFTSQEMTNGINFIIIVADGVTYVKSVVKQ